MSSFTIAQEREIRTIVAEMIGQVLRASDERLRELDRRTVIVTEDGSVVFTAAREETPSAPHPEGH